MAKYFLTNKAVEDLSKIYEYTFELWSQNQADKYYEEQPLINIDKSNNKSILAKLFNNWKEKTKANKKEIQKKQIKINFY